MGFFSRLKDALTKTRTGLMDTLSAVFRGRVDEEFYEELEEALIIADVEMLLVPTAPISACFASAFSRATSREPILPPCPSITRIFCFLDIACTFLVSTVTSSPFL